MIDARAVADIAVQTYGAAQMPYELAGLLDLVNPGGVVVEIGCDAGGVLWAFQQMGAGRVIGVDLPGGLYSSGKPLVTTAEMVIGDSHKQITLHELQQRLDGQLVDLLFIDADHTYEGVRRDFLMYGPLVRPGGLIAFHDICHHKNYPEVRVEQLWWEIKAKPSRYGSTQEIIYYVRPWGSGMGIGVLKTHG